MTFCQAFTEAVLEGCFSFHAEHSVSDDCQCPEPMDVGCDDLNAFANLGFVRRHFALTDATQQLANIYQHLPEYEAIYHRFADEQSRRQLIELFRFRTLGPRHAALSLDEPQYWQLYADLDALRGARADLRLNDKTYRDYSLRIDDRDVALFSTDADIIATFVLEQFTYRHRDLEIGVAPGDRVLDLGGTLGDSALYFAGRCGKDGRVIAFPDYTRATALVTDNLNGADGLAERITVADKAHETGVDASAMTDWITQQIRAEHSTVINFIKIDFPEPARALPSISKLIDTAPTLAIDVHGNPTTLRECVSWLADRNLGYRFFLDHYAVDGTRTMLFAEPDSHARETIAAVDTGFVPC